MPQQINVTIPDSLLPTIIFVCGLISVYAFPQYIYYCLGLMLFYRAFVKYLDACSNGNYFRAMVDVVFDILDGFRCVDHGNIRSRLN